jgi:hypothetical protein
MANPAPSIAFRTPWGRFPSREEAVEECRRRGAPSSEIVTEISPSDVTQETAYGHTVRLPFAIRVF